MSQELEAKLRDRAAQLGFTAEGFATELISAGIGKPKLALTGAALVEYWRSHGLIGYRSDISEPERHDDHCAKRRCKGRDSSIIEDQAGLVHAATSSVSPEGDEPWLKGSI